MVRAIRRRQAIFMAKVEVVWVGAVGGRAGRGLLMLILGGWGGWFSWWMKCGSCWRNSMMWVFLWKVT